MPSATEETPEFDVALSADLLDTLVQPPNTLAADGLTNFHWTSEALYIRTVDPANAVVVNQTVYPEAFDTYNISPEHNTVVFGTRCTTIANLLKAARSTDIVSLALNRESNHLEIEFTDVSYSLSGIDPEAVDEPTVPDLDFDATVTVHSAVFQRAYQVIGMMSETIQFTIDEGQFCVRGKGDTDTAEIDVDIEETTEAIQDRDRQCAALIDDVSQPAEARYSTQFIQYINQFTPSACLKMELSEDHPLRITAEQAEGNHLTEIIIAPRMDSS